MYWHLREERDSISRLFDPLRTYVKNCCEKCMRKIVPLLCAGLLAPVTNTERSTSRVLFYLNCSLFCERSSSKVRESCLKEEHKEKNCKCLVCGSTKTVRRGLQIKKVV
jgi:hypothetical protein